MSSLSIAGIVVASVFGGALIGIFLRRFLPENHLGKESQDVVKLATGLIASMAALVLGLLVAAATSDYNTQKTAIQQLACNLVLLDRSLARYGPETKDVREALRGTVALINDRLWPADGSGASDFDSPELLASSGSLYAALRSLSPATDDQREIKSQALAISADLSRTRWQLTLQDGSSIPQAFLVVLVF